MAKAMFYRVVTVIAGLALLLDGLALVDLILYPLGQDHNFHSTFYRAVTMLVLIPITLLVGFLIIRRVPGNVVGPLLIMWSGSIAYNSIRPDIGLPLFGLYSAYDTIFGWFGLFQMLLHFPNGKLHPSSAARWIYGMLGGSFLTNTLIFLSTDSLEEPSFNLNYYVVPILLPYAQVFLGIGLFLIAPVLILTPISFVLRYRKGSPLERQQIKWLALFSSLLVVYTIVIGIAYPLLTGGQVMSPGAGFLAMLFYFSAGLLPPLVIGIAVLRYRLWDIDRIIRRTLVYSILTAVLALIYFGSVVILQSMFGFFFHLRTNNLAIVLSTLAIAGAFTPLRIRIQQRIDQQFFRKKYSIDQAIAGFAATARTEVVLEPLASALLTNIEETIHPEEVSLWLVSMKQK